MATPPTLTGYKGKRIHNAIALLLRKNHELDKLSHKTNDPAKLKRIIELQRVNRESVLYILLALLTGDHEEADITAQKYLPNP